MKPFTTLQNDETLAEPLHTHLWHIYGLLVVEVRTESPSTTSPTYHREPSHSIIGPIGDGSVCVCGGFEAGIGLNVRGGQSDGGGLCSSGVGGEHVVVASVAHQLLLPLLDQGRVRLQHLCHDHLCLHLKKQSPPLLDPLSC